MALGRSCGEVMKVMTAKGKREPARDIWYNSNKWTHP